LPQDENGFGWLRRCAQKNLHFETKIGHILADGKLCNLYEGEEDNMRKLITICLALAILGFVGVAAAQDTMSHDTMKADASQKAIKITGKISDDGKMFVNDKDKKSWDIVNPEAVKGHEGHHVILTAHVYADKNQVHVMSLAMVK
jgi:predicted KAP-like P-loop ATPase